MRDENKTTSPGVWGGGVVDLIHPGTYMGAETIIKGHVPDPVKATRMARSVLAGTTPRADALPFEK
jgi:hypothetical protein